MSDIEKYIEEREELMSTPERILFEEQQRWDATSRILQALEQEL